MGDEKIDIKKMLDDITEGVTSVTLDQVNKLHISIFEDVIEYGWSDFRLSEDESKIIDMIQKRFEVSDEDRDTLELKVMSGLHKRAAKAKDYEGGVNIYTRMLEIDPDNDVAKKGLKICEKHLDEGANEEEKPEEKKPEAEEKKEEPKKEEKKEEPKKEEKKEEKLEAPPPPPPKTTCPTCGKEATYVDQYQRWYCYNCQKYL